MKKSKKRKMWRTDELPELLGEKCPSNTPMDAEAARSLLSVRLMNRDSFISGALRGIESWIWMRHGDKTVVLLRLNDGHISVPRVCGIGWSVRGKYDRMNEKTGVVVALVRALRDMVS